MLFLTVLNQPCDSNQVGSYSGSWGAICCRQVEGHLQEIASVPAILPKRLILLCKKSDISDRLLGQC